MREQLYQSLAATLLYPGETYRWQLGECRRLAERAVPEAGELLGRFEQATADLSGEQFEELFTQCFDHNPAHALEIGWHLFGEDYHRGALLVRLRQELRRHELIESIELPDHLFHVLSLLGRMAPDEALAFTESCVTPALDKLLEGLRKDESPYLSLLEGVAAVLEHSRKHAFEEMKDGNPIEAS